MAAGPISERNQGNWTGQARNGPMGAGWAVPSRASSVSSWAGDWATQEGARLATVLVGGGVAQCRLRPACRCDAFCVLSPAFPLKKKKSKREFAAEL